MASFTFQLFEIQQDRCAMKVGTDGVLLGAWAEGGNRILDIGSGTGLISLMMAQRFPNAHVVGLDIDREACGQARENVLASPFVDRVVIEECRLQDYSLASGLDGSMYSDKKLFDAIVSNPPFFLNSLKNPDIKRSMARHADSLPFRDLFVGVKKLLSEDGIFSAIVPTDVLESFCAEACFSGLFMVRKCLVRTVAHKHPKRCLVAFAKHRSRDVESSEVCMMDAEGKRSAWYAKITEKFYIK